MNQLFNFVAILFTINYQTVAPQPQNTFDNRLGAWALTDPNVPIPPKTQATKKEINSGQQNYKTPRDNRLTQEYELPQIVPCNWCLRDKCNPGACQEAPNFDAKADAEKLRGAMEGAGTKEETIFQILMNRSEKQIELIKQEYLGFGVTSLEHDIKSDTSLNVEDLLLAFLKPRAEFFADELYKAFKNLDDKAMIMILSSLPTCAIKEVRAAYYHKREKHILKAVKHSTVLKFQEFMEEIVKANRETEDNVDLSIAKSDAREMWESGPNAWIKKKRFFIDMFTHRSFNHIRKVKEFYNKIYASPNFDKAIAEHTGGGKLTAGLLAILRNMEDPLGYFTDELEGALHHLIVRGIRDNSTVIRILRGRCGIDLGDIRDAYPKNHDGKALVDVIKEKSFLDYEKALVQLLTPQNVAENP